MLARLQHVAQVYARSHVTIVKYCTYYVFYNYYSRYDYHCSTTTMTITIVTTIPRLTFKQG